MFLYSSNDDGVTPVHIAAIWGRVENLKLLIGCGGDPGQRDLDGHSAFDYATREEQWEVFDYLHNVVDLTDDAPGHKCAYTLDLGKFSGKWSKYIGTATYILNRDIIMVVLHVMIMSST